MRRTPWTRAAYDDFIAWHDGDCMVRPLDRRDT